MLARGFDVKPTDGSPELAEVASRRLGRAVKTLLFQDLDEVEAYHGVWANACLLHVPRAELAPVLALVRHALKPGGAFYASYKTGDGDGRDTLNRYYNYRRPIGCALPTPRLATGASYRSKRARSGVLTIKWPRCCSSWLVKALEPFAPSNHLENRQRQHGLREKADGKGEGAEHRQADRIDDQVRHAGPEIDRAGIDGPFGGVIELREDQDQRREDDEVFDRVVVREHHAGGPFRMRLVVARGIGHGGGEAADLAAVEDVGNPEQSREDHRQRQPEQFARHRFHRFPLNRFLFPNIRLYPSAKRCATREPGHS